MFIKNLFLIYYFIYVFEFNYLVSCGDNFSGIEIESENAAFLENDNLLKRKELIIEQYQNYHLDEDAKCMFNNFLEVKNNELLGVVLSFLEIFHDNINLNSNILNLSNNLIVLKMLNLLNFQVKIDVDLCFQKISVITRIKIILSEFLDVKNKIDCELNVIFISYKKKMEELFKEHETLHNFVLQEKFQHHVNFGKRTKTDTAKFINSAIKRSISIKNETVLLYNSMCNAYREFIKALQDEKSIIIQKYYTLDQQFESEEQNKPNEEKLNKKYTENFYRIFIKKIMYTLFFESDVIAPCFFMVEKDSKKMENNHSLIIFAFRIINNLNDFFYEG